MLKCSSFLELSILCKKCFDYHHVAKFVRSLQYFLRRTNVRFQRNVSRLFDVLEFNRKYFLRQSCHMRFIYAFSALWYNKRMHTGHAATFIESLYPKLNNFYIHAEVVTFEAV